MCMCSCHHCIWDAGAYNIYDGATAYHIRKTATADVDYLNKDGSKTAYLVDSLYLKPDEYSLICSEFNEHIFLIPNIILKNKRRLTLKYLLNSPECYIVHKNMWFIPDLREKLSDYPINTKQIQESVGKGNFYCVRYEYPPKYFRFYLIRGDFFNNGICHIQPHIYIPIDFPNDKHFYKLLIPVWDEEGIAEAARMKKLRLSINEHSNDNKIRIE